MWHNFTHIITIESGCLAYAFIWTTGRECVQQSELCQIAGLKVDHATSRLTWHLMFNDRQMQMEMEVTKESVACSHHVYKEVWWPVIGIKRLLSRVYTDFVKKRACACALNNKVCTITWFYGTPIFLFDLLQQGRVEAPLVVLLGADEAGEEDASLVATDVTRPVFGVLPETILTVPVAFRNGRQLRLKERAALLIIYAVYRNRSPPFFA